MAFVRFVDVTECDDLFMNSKLVLILLNAGFSLLLQSSC